MTEHEGNISRKQRTKDFEETKKKKFRLTKVQVKLMYSKRFFADPEMWTGFIRCKFQQQCKDVARGLRDITEIWRIYIRFN